MTGALRKPQADRAAVLTKATMRAAALLGLNNSDLARVIGVSGTLVSRYRHHKAGIDPDSKPGQLALLLVRILRSLDPLVGSDEAKRKAWMRSHNTALNGVPAQLLLNPEGLVRTLNYLDGMRAPA